MKRTSKPTLLNQTEFGRVVGVSQQRVSKAIQHGKLDGALVGSGRTQRIDLEKGMLAWAENIAPVQQIGGRARQAKERAGEVQQGSPQKAGEGPPAKTGGKRNINQLSLAELQKLQARYKVLSQKVDLDEKLKRVIPIEQVNKEFFDLARLVRDAILSVPDKVSAIIAAESSERRVNRILTEHLHEALKGLKRD